MKQYKAREGVILTRICDEYLLVSGKKTRDICPYLTQINELSAFLWEKLINGADLEELLSFTSDEYEIDDRESVKESISQFLQQMVELGYLITTESSD